MKYFLQRHLTLISTLLAISFVVVFLLFVVVLAAREQRMRVDNTTVVATSADDLPGKHDNISKRTEEEIKTLLGDNPHVVGAYASKIHYGKTENPILYFFGKNDLIQTLYDNYALVQKSGKGHSSAELDAARAQSRANTEETKTGVIKCGPLSATNIGQLAPGIDKYVKSTCRAAIPAFDENVNLAVVVMVDLDTTRPEDEQAFLEIRRLLLQLQIDIYNRDFKGRETWAHPQ